MAETAAQVRGSWAPEDLVIDHRASALVAHGSLGDPGYHELHPGNRGKGLRRLGPPREGVVGSPDHTEEEHMQALEDYIDTPDVNFYLRKGRAPSYTTDDAMKKSAATLNDLIQIQDPLTEDKEVYRGGLKLPPMQVGDEFTDRGFSSTSEDPMVATIFAKAPKFKNGGENGDVLTITIPAGARALEVYSVYPHGSEDEWILPPGTVYRVTAVTNDGYAVEVVNG